MLNWLRNVSSAVKAIQRDVSKTEKAETNHECNLSNVRECHIYQTQRFYAQHFFYALLPMIRLLLLHLSRTHTRHCRTQRVVFGLQVTWRRGLTHCQQLLLNWISFTDRKQFFVRAHTHSTHFSIAGKKSCDKMSSEPSNAINHKYI